MEENKEGKKRRSVPRLSWWGEAFGLGEVQVLSLEGVQ